MSYELGGGGLQPLSEEVSLTHHLGAKSEPTLPTLPLRVGGNGINKSSHKLLTHNDASPCPSGPASKTFQSEHLEPPRS